MNWEPQYINANFCEYSTYLRDDFTIVCVRDAMQIIIIRRKTHNCRHLKLTTIEMMNVKTRISSSTSSHKFSLISLDETSSKR